jgi:hypothetical protein
VGCCFWCPRLHREIFSAKGLDVPPGEELRAAAVHNVQLLAALVPTRLGVGLVEETRKVLLWGLIPQLPLRHCSISVRDLLFAGSPRRGGAIPGPLVTPLAEALYEFLDLAAFSGVVASPGMNRTRPKVGTLLARVLAIQFLAPGRCCRGDQSPSLRPVDAAVLLILLLAAARGNDTGAPLWQNRLKYYGSSALVIA